MNQFIQGQLIDKYTLLKLIGKGGFGEVWEVEDPNSSKYAMKVFNLLDLNSQEKFNLFEDEFYLSTNLNHPNLLIPTQLGRFNDVSFIIMPLCDKSLMDDLKERMISKVSNAYTDSCYYSEKELATILRDVADGLAYLNEVGVIHKDIKPDNILIKESGQNKVYKISDFGISDKFTISALKITRMLDIKNDSIAKAYAAPEYFKKKVDTKSDIFSLGVSIVELLTGDLPAGNNGLAFGESLDKDISNLELANYTEYSRRFIKLIQACLNYNPKLRPSAKNIALWTEDYLNKGYWPNEMMDQLLTIKSNKSKLLSHIFSNNYSKLFSILIIILFLGLSGDTIISQFYYILANNYLKNGDIIKASQNYRKAIPIFITNNNLIEKQAITNKIIMNYIGISRFYDNFSIAHKENGYTLISEKGDNVLGYSVDEIVYLGNGKYLLRNGGACSQFSLFDNGKIENLNSGAQNISEVIYASILYKLDDKIVFKACYEKNISLIK